MTNGSAARKFRRSTNEDFMNAFSKFLLSTLAIVAVLSLTTVIASKRVSADKELTRDDVKQIVRETIMAEPELVMQSLNQMQAKQAQDESKKAGESVKDNLKELTSNPDSPVVGNPKGDVTLVEFFDYHCGYCKHLYPDVAKLMGEDKNLRIVMKEYPILGPGSMLAAKAAMGVHALNPDKYFEYHGLLMQQTGEFTEEGLLDTAAKLGIDKGKLKTEMNKPETEKKLQDVMTLGMKIGAQGTPTLVVGEELIPGAIGYEPLKAKIDALRKK
jgi:protein-disulfide isomerase